VPALCRGAAPAAAPPPVARHWHPGELNMIPQAEHLACRDSQKSTSLSRTSSLSPARTLKCGCTARQRRRLAYGITFSFLPLLAMNVEMWLHCQATPSAGIWQNFLVLAFARHCLAL